MNESMENSTESPQGEGRPTAAPAGAMKLEYAVPRRTDFPPACHPLVAIAGAVVYMACVFLLPIVFGIASYLGLSFEIHIALGVAICIAAFCGWRTYDAMREFRRSRR